MALSKVRQQELVSIWKPTLKTMRDGWYSATSVRDALSGTAFRSNNHRYVGAPSHMHTFGFSRQTGGHDIACWSLEDATLLAHYYRRQGYKAIATAIRRAWYEILLEAEPGL